MKFICLTLMIFIVITSSRSDKFEVLGPSDPIFAVAGEDVILPCYTKPNFSIVDMRVEWFRPDLAVSLVHLYEDREYKNIEQIQSYRGRTELILQELPRGNASLKLSSVKVSDGGSYKCLIRSKSRYDDAIIDVNVEAVGSPPVITVDGFDGSGGLHLKCESEGWFPEPDLEWLDSEGVRLSSKTSETHKNTDKFNVKHTIIVHQSEGKIHCRVRLRHHMLETLIITTSNMFTSWRTSVTVIAIVVVLSVIAAILIAVFVHKYREYSSLHSKLEKDKMSVDEEKRQLLDERDTREQEHNELLDENVKLKSECNQLQNMNKNLQHAKSQIENEKSRIINDLSTECDRHLQSQKTIITQALTHLRTHKVNVILDANSAHPCLTVSGNGKQVRDENQQTDKVDGKEAQRFDKYLGVLGQEGFSSGCFYFEVQVKGQIKWDLGVIRASTERKGLISLNPDNGYWTVGLRQECYWARELSNAFLALRVKPERVGVFVDYEKGLVSFYDVESSSHIYSFTGQSFNEKLYPFVSLGDLRNRNSTPLIICDDY